MSGRTENLSAALDRAVACLLAERNRAGHWRGELSSSALSTATGAMALQAVDAHAHRAAIDAAIAWLVEHANADGGYGDTVLSVSNLSTTLLAWAALGRCGKGDEAGLAERNTGEWIARRAGGTDPQRIVRAVLDKYGDDRTFSVPILTALALTGRLGEGPDAWESIPQLPFELAALPHGLLKAVGLPVVSYALPALIAIGQVRHHHRPGRNRLIRRLRGMTTAATRRKLERIQPESGGYLEAAPLTSFVTMAMAAMGQADLAVVRRAVGFLTNTQRADGSWPIDTDLATWVTTQSVTALARDGHLADRLDRPAQRRIGRWLLAQQHRRVHPYTAAAPGGWAWTDLSGGVPDADDTPGALVALANLTPQEGPPDAATSAAVRWLIGLQNRDGGFPTFCRGWGKLPFDRSCPDLTAHAIRAMLVWRHRLKGRLARRAERSLGRAVTNLRRTQREDGSWVPLWFGNQHAIGQLNPTYGTARVLPALVAAIQAGHELHDEAARAARWLVRTRHGEGGWGGDAAAPASVEETALAVDALCGWLAGPGRQVPDDQASQAVEAVRSGVDWLLNATGQGREFPAAPIGLYFAQLWYFERLYPLAWTVSAWAAAGQLTQLADG